MGWKQFFKLLTHLYSYFTNLFPQPKSSEEPSAEVEVAAEGEAPVGVEAEAAPAEEAVVEEAAPADPETAIVEEDVSFRGKTRKIVNFSFTFQHSVAHFELDTKTHSQMVPALTC